MTQHKKRRLSLMTALMFFAVFAFYIVPIVAGQSLTDVSLAKKTLQKMGVYIKPEGPIGGGSLVDTSVQGESSPDTLDQGVVDYPELASKFGMVLGGGIQLPRPPVQKGTKLYFTIATGGKITFYLNDQKMMRDNNNQVTSVFIDPTLLPQGVEVKYSSFPTR